MSFYNGRLNMLKRYLSVQTKGMKKVGSLSTAGSPASW